MKYLPGWILLAVCAAGIGSTLIPKPPRQACPGPDCPNIQPQVPIPQPTPAPNISPWAPNRTPRSVETISTGGPRLPDGTEVQVYLPYSQRIRNRGGSDGAGMCVMSSIEMMFRWGNLENYRGLRDWCAQFPGGAYPTKVDQQLSRYSAERHTPLPPYFQYEGRDVSLLQLALTTGRPVAVTYGPAHMVLLVHYDQQRVAILDNNAIGENELLWMTPQDFLTKWTTGPQGSGWAVFSIAPPPPPIPRNARALFDVTYPSTIIPAPSVSDILLYGVMDWHISKTERITASGRSISKEEARSLIQGTIPMDQNFLRLTVIGPASETARVLADIQANVSGNVMVNAFPPDHWAVQVGFVTAGHPTIYLQRPDGTVLHRQDDYSGGIGALITAIRRADPSYQPSSDPNLSRTTFSFPFDLAAVPVWAYISGLGGLFYLLIPHRS